MKRLTFTCLLFLFSISMFAQNWINPQSIGGSGTETGGWLATDLADNVIVGGQYSSPQLTIGSSTYTNAGSNDFFLLKKNNAGTIIWSNSFGGNDADQLSGVACDNAGNVFITGTYFSATLDIGGTQLTNLSGGQNENIFLAKLDANGNVLWAKSIIGDSTVSSAALACDINGNIILVGSFFNTSLRLDSITLYNPDALSSFIAKYDASGNIVYAINNSVGYSEAVSVSVDLFGNAYVFGYYSDSLFTFGSNVIVPYSYMGWTPDLYILKCNPTGTINWLKDIGGTDYDIAGGIATDQSGNSYVTGSTFSNTVYFDSDSTINNNVGGDDFFLARYDSAGNALWAKQLDSGIGAGEKVCTDQQGNVYVGGIYYSTITIGSATFPLNDVTAFSDLFVAKYNSSGTAQWAAIAGGDGYEDFSSLAVDRQNNLQVAGYYSSAMVDFAGSSISNAGDYDIFTASIGGTCAAGFFLYPDTTQLHHYNAVNTSIGSGPLTYLWSWGDGTFDNIAYPTHTYANAGFYSICLSITDSTGCSSTVCDSSVYLQRSTNTMVSISVYPSLITNIESFAQNQSLVVYPNPTTGYFHIAYSFIPSKYKIEVFDITGKQISSDESTDTVYHSPRKLENGMYLIRITSNNFTTMKGLIVE